MLVVNMVGHGKPRMTQCDKWKKRRCIIDYFAWADKLRLAAITQGFTLSNEFSVQFHFVPPKSFSKKKQMKMFGTPHNQKPDLDNMIKAIMDVLRPGDDQLIYSVAASKYWSPLNSIVIMNIDV